MSDKIKVLLKDRLDRIHILEGINGQSLSSFLLKNFIPKDAVIPKVDNKIVDDDAYILNGNEKLILEMVRAYQLPEYCRMLQLWEDVTNRDNKQDNKQNHIYTKKFLWFNDSGICQLKYKHFNNKEFIDWVDNNFVEGIINKNLIEENETILLALSGGRDSLALLYLLRRNKERLPKFNLVGVTVGDSAASNEDVKVATEAMEDLGVSDYTILPLDYLTETMNFKHGFESAIEKALLDGGRGRSISLWHCIMRANVERFARERGIKKIAFGYQHEDLMASVFRTNTLGVLYGESAWHKSWGDFEIIAPLWTVTKKELTIYLEDIAPVHHTKQGSPTDYDRGDHNRDINYFMSDMLQSMYPGIGYAFFESLSQLHKNYEISKPNYFQCKNCGITYNDRYSEGKAIDPHYCTHCLYLKELGEIEKFKVIGT